MKVRSIGFGKNWTHNHRQKRNGEWRRKRKKKKIDWPSTLPMENVIKKRMIDPLTVNGWWTLLATGGVAFSKRRPWALVLIWLIIGKRPIKTGSYSGVVFFIGNTCALKFIKGPCIVGWGHSSSSQWGECCRLPDWPIKGRTLPYSAVNDYGPLYEFHGSLRTNPSTEWILSCLSWTHTFPLSLFLSPSIQTSDSMDEIDRQKWIDFAVGFIFF